MAVRYLKCLYCGGTIDRDNDIDYSKVSGNRYAHWSCIKRHDEVNDLLEYVKSILGNTMVMSKTTKQVDEYLKNGRTCSGIRNALRYWYEIKGNDISKSGGGIGIVDYIYDEANDYFEHKEKIRDRMSNIDGNLIDKYKRMSSLHQPVPAREKISKPRHMTFFDIR